MDPPDLLRSRVYRRAVSAATRLISSNRRLSRLLGSATARLQHPTAALAGLRDDLLALIRMVREVARGRYRALPKRTLVAVVAGLIYLVNPLDVIPDFIPALGFLDDATVLWWVLHQIRNDLDRYLEWEREWGSAIDVESVTEPGPGTPSLPADGGS